ncbi:MAG: hypothetical protein WC686_00040 [Candidatus Shapirobacteria bacterium]|jgi:hypothetical protein
MEIDDLSKKLVKMAMCLDNQVPGMAGEIWLEKEWLEEVKSDLPKTENEYRLLEEETKRLTRGMKDERRKEYIKGMLKSMNFLYCNWDKKIDYRQFSCNVFGKEICRVNETEIREIEIEIRSLEKEIGLTRQEVYKKNLLKKEQYQEIFANNCKIVKDKFRNILNVTDNGIEFELSSQKPWGAFNSHVAPFKSKIILNSDINFGKYDLWKLAVHEGYGGHHSELSNKDKLLMEGRGEHGLVITYSPQAFVSEALAEAMMKIGGFVDNGDKEQKLVWYYDRLTFGLQNLATYWFNDDGLEIKEIRERLRKFYISDKTTEIIINFSTDKIYWAYAPVYYSAYNWLMDIYNRTNRKTELIIKLFSEPCTPGLVEAEFGEKS